MTPPRFLTPEKICLLLLIDLYNADYVQGPTRLDLLSFVQSHIHGLPDTSDHGQLSSSSQLTSSIDSIESAFSTCSSGTSERSIYDLLLHCLWKLTDLDSLFTLFLSAEELVAPTSPDSTESAAAKISRASPIGQFIRRCCVEFTRLRFADAQSLWNSLCAYRAPTFEVWASQNPEAAAEFHPEQMPGAEHPEYEQDDVFASADDTSLLLSHSISHLQKLGTRLPSSLKAQLAAWSSSLPDSSLQHFLAFFEHWRAGAYTMALEALHRYFDYCLIGQQDLAAGVSGTVGAGQGGWMKMYYQYALLHLSVLHADFERWEESVEALGECVATARENQDSTCLSFALSYLLYLRQSHPQNSHLSFNSLTRLIGGGSGSRGEQDEISFLKTKAREGRHWNLLASTLLEEARGEMYSGGNVSKALECILQSEYLCVQHDLRNMMPAASLFRGASLERLGQASLCTQTYENIDVVHGSHCPLPDSVRANCRLSHDLACAGEFDRALKVLSEVKQTAAKGILKLEQRVLVFEMLVALRKNIHGENFEAADALLEQLRPARGFAESEVTFEITILEVELLRKKEDYQLALHVINNAIQQLKQTPRTDLAHTLHLLNLKARVFACAGEPLKGLSIALRAAASAERHLLISVLAEAITLLGSILIDLHKYDAALRLLNAAAPMVLEEKDVAVTVRLFTALAHAAVGYAGHECDPGSSEQLAAIQEAKRILKKSHQACRQLRDPSAIRDCLTLMGKIAKWQGDIEMVRKSDLWLRQIEADPT